MSFPTSGAARYTYEGFTGTARDWAQRLGMTERGFTHRVSTYGEADPRTYAYRGAPPRRVYGWEGVKLEGPSRHGHGIAARHAEVEALLDACPELRDCETREDAYVTAAVFARWFGPMGLSEIALVLGVTRERARQIEQVALKKIKLSGGRDLRELWEHVSQRDSITWAEASELVAWGLDEDGGDE